MHSTQLDIAANAGLPAVTRYALSERWIRVDRQNNVSVFAVYIRHSVTKRTSLTNFEQPDYIMMVLAVYVFCFEPFFSYVLV